MDNIFLLTMAENLVNAIAQVLDWRQDPHMTDRDCLALKICAIIQVFSMFQTNSEL